MKCSIIIPARNEEKLIASCIDSIKKSAEIANVSHEIIVVINRCTDSTAQIAAQHGCKLVYDDTKNLSHIRNSGAKSASGDIIVTIDADSRASKNMLATIVSKLGTGKVVGGGVTIIPERISLGIFVSILFLVPIALRYGIQCGLFYVSREDYFRIGGFDESLTSVEDIDFARRLKKLGKAKGQRFSMFSLAYIVTSCRKFDRFGDWYFIKNYKETLSLLRGNDQEAANKIWYDFER